MTSCLAKSSDKEGFSDRNKKLKVVLFTALIVGILAHGMALFNEYAIGDTTFYLFDVGATLTSGRWFLHFMGQAVHYVFDGKYAVPLLIGVVSLLFLSASSYLIIELMDLKKTSSWVFTTAVIILFPTVVSAFLYPFTAAYYVFAILLSTLGVYIICRRRRVDGFALGVVLLSCAVGTYQAYASYIIALFVLVFIKEVEKSDEERFLPYFQKALYFIFAIVAFMGLYFLLTKLSLQYYHLQLDDYQGINTMGQDGIGVYLARTKYAFLYFLRPLDLRGGIENSMFPMRLKALYYLIMILSSLLVAWNLLLKGREKKFLQGAFFLAGILALPIAANFIFVMCHPKSVHSLMLYGEVTLFLFAIWIFDRMREYVRFPKPTLAISLSAFLLILACYCYYDNICYLKLDLVQTRVISYCTTLVSQIKGTKGYKDEYPVAYIEPNKIQDKNIVDFVELQKINITPLYETSDFLRISHMTGFLNTWCAFQPVQADAESFQELPEVKAMPCYPDEGSIKVINETVIVKFGNSDGDGK